MDCSEGHASLACEVAELSAMAAPVDGAPDACAVIDAAVDRLDLRSFDNSAGPRLDRDAATVPSDLFAPHILPFCAGATLDEDGWSRALLPLGTGDWTGEGAAQALVVFQDRAQDRTYDVTETLILSGIEGDGPVTAMPGCTLTHEGCPDR